jgi:excisionase family DNA binding protein
LNNFMEVTYSIEKGYLSVDEVARYLGVKPSTIRNWAKEGKITQYKPRRMYWFKKEEIDAWMESHRGDVTVVDKRAKKVLETAKNPKCDVHGILRKVIEEVRGNSYNDNYGKPDQIKGLRKEVKNGNL